MTQSFRRTLQFEQITIVFGVTLHNNATYLRTALESLAGQTHADFGVVMLDDASTDDTSTIAKEFATGDHRFFYFRNEERVGMAAAWRQAYSLATSRYPGMLFFAWASDHDMWEPSWLEKLLWALQTHPDAVLAFPFAQRIDADGNSITHDVRKGSFTTLGCSDQCARFRKVTRLRRNFGNMVYGLYRAGALASAGIFRDVPIPDRLLMQELALAGHLVQVEEVLWHRRFKQAISLKRQVRALWPEGQRPATSHLPWEMQHTYWLIRAVLRPDGFSPNTRLGSKLAMVLEQLRFIPINLFSRRFGLF